MRDEYQAILDKVPDVPPDSIEFGNIGLCGAHRTGKTTLAIALSQTLDIPFVPIDASSVFLQNGFAPSDKLDIRTRVFLQQEILKKAEEIWFHFDEPQFICDHTPVDMAAYLLADVGNGELDAHTQTEIEDYLDDCCSLIKKYFPKIVLVPPAIAPVFDPSKAAINKPLIQKLHLIMLGLLRDWELSYQLLPKHCLEIGYRVDFVSGYWRQN